MERTSDRDADGRRLRSPEATTHGGRAAPAPSIPDGVIDLIVVGIEAGEPVVRDDVVAEARVRLATVDLPSAEAVADSFVDYCVAVRER